MSDWHPRDMGSDEEREAYVHHCEAALEAELIEDRWCSDAERAFYEHYLTASEELAQQALELLEITLTHERKDNTQ